MESSTCKFLKLNFDGVVLTSNDGAADFVFRNDQGYPILASSKNPGKSNVLLSKALALRADLIVAVLHDT